MNETQFAAVATLISAITLDTSNMWTYFCFALILILFLWSYFKQPLEVRNGTAKKDI